MIELRRLRSRTSLSPTVWLLTLELARICGWNPQGTRLINPSDGTSTDPLHDVRHLMSWQIEYLSNEGHTVTDTDANQLADALDRAGADGNRILANWIDGRSKPPVDVRTSPNGFRWFATVDGKDHLHAIADFCRGGAFQIF